MAEEEPGQADGQQDRAEPEQHLARQPQGQVDDVGVGPDDRQLQHHDDDEDHGGQPRVVLVADPHVQERPLPDQHRGSGRRHEQPGEDHGLAPDLRGAPVLAGTDHPAEPRHDGEDQRRGGERHGLRDEPGERVAGHEAGGADEPEQDDVGAAHHLHDEVPQHEPPAQPQEAPHRSALGPGDAEPRDLLADDPQVTPPRRDVVRSSATATPTMPPPRTTAPAVSTPPTSTTAVDSPSLL